MTVDSSKPRVSQYFKASTVNRHIRKHHPNCSVKHRKAIVKRVIGRGWVDANIGRAVGIVMDGYIRHRLTDYDTLLKNSVERAEARAMIKAKVDERIKAWGPPARGDGSEI